MNMKSLLQRLKQNQNLDKNVFQILVGLQAFYVLYYIILILSPTLLHLILAPTLLHLDIDPYYYRNPFSYVIIAAMALVSIALPFATNYSSRKKRYVFFAFGTLLWLVPHLIMFELFIRADWSFAD